MDSNAKFGNVFTVDLEEYFQVEAFSDVVPRSSWGMLPSRLSRSTHALLDILDDAGVKATFFSLGWVARHHGALLREVVGRGHEIACHSYWHRPLYSLSPGEFLADTLAAKGVIEQEAGVAVTGYRAPSFSMTDRTPWAFEILAEAGFSYDSSVFPIHHDIYGMPGAPRSRYIAAAGIVECPMTTFRWLGQNWPVGGGGYLRIMPWWMTQAGLRRVLAEGREIVGYFHPWELDPDQPRLNGRVRSVLRHYTNLSKAEEHLRLLLRLTAFTTFRDSVVSAEHVAGSRNV